MAATARGGSFWGFLLRAHLFTGRGPLLQVNEPQGGTDGIATSSVQEGGNKVI